MNQTNINKLKMKTPNKTDINIQDILKLFPNIATEKDGKKAIDFDLLRQMLSEDIIEGDEERYRLDWPGKKASLLKANSSISKTLRPCKEESVDFDTTQNLYIEGDNFEVLKLIQESYLGKIKMIYIDPPYNTGKDFVYRDNFKESKEEFEEKIGLKDEDENKLFKNTDSNGRFHSDWLSMMYERLIVARDLLKDDGVIFISIDDNEVHNLRKICDEVFGEGNFVGQISIAKGTTTGQDANKIGSSIDYLLVYTKKIDDFILVGLPMTEKDKLRFSLEDSKGKYSILQFRKTGSNDRREDRPNLFYPITAPDGTEIYPYHPSGYESTWRTSLSSYKKWIDEDLIVWKKDSNDEYKPYVKYYLEGRTKQVPNLWNDIDGNKKASLIIKKLFDKKLFDFPKPVELLTRCMRISNISENDIILDFFSGSATTAHAVMDLNAQDGGNRKFIMVQLPETTDEKSEAFKAGYKTIPEIGKERIRRAGKKILEDNSKLNTQNSKLDLDIGFRVLKVDDTNFKDIYYHPSKLSQEQLGLFDTTIKEDRDGLDVLFQILLDLGVELSLPINAIPNKENPEFFIVEDGELIVCIKDEIQKEDIEYIKSLNPLNVVLKESCFKADKDKINLVQNLSLVTTVSVI
ncbi:MAG: site-specific DNA-methyltransferase [Campylobacterota bacterium]|nr:site-specific DNA-methyltransferase [Campylobacterota bacterium]